jgi:hypothetical protein
MFDKGRRCKNLRDVRPRLESRIQDEKEDCSKQQRDDVVGEENNPGAGKN